MSLEDIITKLESSKDAEVVAEALHAANASLKNQKEEGKLGVALRTLTNAMMGALSKVPFSTAQLKDLWDETFNALDTCVLKSTEEPWISRAFVMKKLPSIMEYKTESMQCHEDETDEEKRERCARCGSLLDTLMLVTRNEGERFHANEVKIASENLQALLVQYPKASGVAIADLLKKEGGTISESKIASFLKGLVSTEQLRQSPDFALVLQEELVKELDASPRSDEIRELAMLLNAQCEKVATKLSAQQSVGEVQEKVLSTLFRRAEGLKDSSTHLFTKDGLNDLLKCFQNITSLHHWKVDHYEQFVQLIFDAWCSADKAGISEEDAELRYPLLKLWASVTRKVVELKKVTGNNLLKTESFNKYVAPILEDVWLKRVEKGEVDSIQMTSLECVLVVLREVLPVTEMQEMKRILAASRQTEPIVAEHLKALKNYRIPSRNERGRGENSEADISLEELKHWQNVLQSVSKLVGEMKPQGSGQQQSVAPSWEAGGGRGHGFKRRRF